MTATARESILPRVDDVFTRVVRPARWPATHPVTITANHLPGEPVPHDEAVAGPFVPFAEGDPWGTDWSTTWFHVVGTVPDAWAGRDSALVVDLGYSGGTGFGAEGQVWIDGRPVRGISPNHREVPVAAPAVGGEIVDLHLEAAANPPAPPGDPGRLLLPDPEGEPTLVLRRCRLAVVDREVEALVRDWRLVREMADWVGGMRSGEAVAALDEVAALVEDGGIDRGTVADARRRLGTVLGAPGAPSRHTHLAVGNSHLDTAWLWPLRETRRKAVRTFSTAATLLDEHPDYRFAASQAQHLAWIRDDQPELWARIREHVDAGRFELVGSTWVEPDCNVPSGESLVRQIVHGRRFFRDELGVDSPGLWLPDTFGYSAALPQILAAAGIDWFMTQKISWNEVNAFPHHTFWWEGIDGTRVLTHLPPADTYNGDFSLPNLLHGERNAGRQPDRWQSLYLYGHGDGGGGPDVDMLERARRLADVDGVGRVELTGATEAMARIRQEGTADLPVWAGELYLEKHRGTYTTHGEVKRANRELELALRDTELWTLAAARLAGRSLPVDRLDRAWKTLLLHQFHDILPGTSIHWVHQDTAAAHAELRTTVDELSTDALASIAAGVDTGAARRPVLVANGTNWARDEVIELDGSLQRVTAPPCGWTVHDLSDPAPGPHPPVTAGDGWMDNGLLRVEWDDAGLLRSVRHHATGREAVAPGRAANLLQRLDDHPAEWDAWDIDADAFDTAVDLTGADEVALVESGGMRAAVRIVRTFGRSRIEQHIRLTRGSGRVEIHCDVDWHEDHTLLKLAFPVAVHSASARHEIQFGHVSRPTHRNTSWERARFETCAHTWVDLSDDEFGVAVLNDSKYGHDVRDNVIRLSLLRAPTWPDPVADRGRHRFACALYPHAGPPTTGGVVREAHTFNSPLRIVMCDAGGDAATTPRGLPARHSLLAVDDPGVVVSAVKAADRGPGTVVRLHEAFGAPRRVVLRAPGATAAARVDLLEEPLDLPGPEVRDGAVTLDLRPFELVTLRLDTGG